VWIVVIILLLIMMWSSLHLILRSSANTRPIIVAHRAGAGLAPENTMAAVQSAISRNDSYIEVDVQRTSDNVLVLMHDNTVDRITDATGSVGDWSWKDLSRLDVGSHYSSKYSGESIPSLEQALKILAETNITLFLEAKSPGNYPGIDKQIKDIIDISKSSEKVRVISFDHAWLNQFHQIAPDIQTGLICLWENNFSHLNRSKTLVVFWAGIVADPTLIKKAHKNGLIIIAWTVNNRLLMKTLLWLGTDGIITNFPDRGHRALNINSK
jgi:glycerophosphoryl diester phosphodiesterase